MSNEPLTDEEIAKAIEAMYNDTEDPPMEEGNEGLILPWQHSEEWKAKVRETTKKELKKIMEEKFGNE